MVEANVLNGESTPPVKDKKNRDQSKKRKKTPKKEANGHSNISEQAAENNGTELLYTTLKNENSVDFKQDPEDKSAIKKKTKRKNDQKIKCEESMETEGASPTSKKMKMDESEEDEDENSLSKFSISKEIKETLKARGITSLFPIQSVSFEPIMAGQDVRAQSRTGTGKTLAFAIPVAEKLLTQENSERGRPPKVLCMVPTRELADQIKDQFRSLSNNIYVEAIYGGVPYEKQEFAFRRGTDVIVGTPGRLFDFIEKGTLDLSKLQYVILDEVDRMLDMGFAEIVGNILKYAYNLENKESNPQTLLYSATMPDWVYREAAQYMRTDNLKEINLVGTQGVNKTAASVQHLAICYQWRARCTIVGNLLTYYSGNEGRAMVFCQTKKEADEMTMSKAISQDVHVLHGDIPQEKRSMVLNGFREGRYKVLITTDVAARGLDIPEVDLVIQTSPPKDVDSYIHRSGRTGRAGRQGVCVCLYTERETYALRGVENQAGIKFKQVNAPSQDDLLEATSNDIVKSLESVSEEARLKFEAHAARLIKERGALQSLSAALAVISGNTEVKTTSILTHLEGKTAYLFTCDKELHSKGYIFCTLRKFLPENVCGSVTGLRMLEDRTGAVFDLPSEYETVVAERWVDSEYNELEKATTLPELEAVSEGGNGRGRYGSPRGGRGYGRGGGFSQGRGSFGRGGGRGFSSRGFTRGKTGSRSVQAFGR